MVSESVDWALVWEAMWVWMISEILGSREGRLSRRGSLCGRGWVSEEPGFRRGSSGDFAGDGVGFVGFGGDGGCAAGGGDAGSSGAAGG